jgi:hypothetical protein
MHRDHIRTQLLDHICSPNLDASIGTVILECGHCKNFGNVHVHALLTPVTRRRPFELLVGDYLSMPTRKGGYSKIGLFADVFTRKLWGFKSKSAASKNTVDGLRRISQTFVAPGTFMADGSSHFDCNEVWSYCVSIRTKLHIVSPFSDLVHLRPASPLDNCPSQTSQPNRPVTGPKPTGRSICCTHL